MRTSLLWALLAVSAAALPARAQDEIDADELVYGGVLTNASDWGSGCPKFGAPWLRRLTPEERGRLETDCDRADYEDLERSGDRLYSFARYRWTTVKPPVDWRRSLARDTVREDEVVVFSQPLGGGPFRPEWRARHSTHYIASMHPETGPTEDGGVLMGVQACSSGTGGCQQHFLVKRRGGRWRPVREAWIRQLPASMRGRFWKGTYVNPMTLQGSASLYSRGDGNCCPSNRLYFRVLLRGDSLVLRDYRVAPIRR